jgi:PAS domain-containing protein
MTVVDNEAQTAVAFCGHCGARPRSHLLSGAPSRVCALCELGLILRAAPAAAPDVREAFLVVGAALEVCAVSDRAEQLLGVSETDAVNRHLGEFLAPDDERPTDYARLMDAVPRLVVGAAPIDALLVRAVQTPTGALRVRLGACGPPPAALLVFLGRE